ncbi:ferredoxin (2Fe-2S) [Natrialba magadii ATCC 43099]|uniref:Ferredoxin n=1 Tax=Natrialba magadii (strain ATCC 43099 / DSM 3394 / CCM 3739 / CIP 104546 / IAM 13178 / JCM 8861 / NBRC 102185 / NCIMB 2190 / MS3) TaxID=547559 RepID=D3SVZ4_NATMM|nr:2Fe-2S iron-sulfur cluster binding domain-containing protein [Natrialba magadii]ADD05655.1 ferredoxin (2Fe-2S) [Natrialba magadii ATCC 43099]ELY29933.1 ferredoxin [Natrialba magadii ATCC 43099]
MTSYEVVLERPGSPDHTLEVSKRETILEAARRDGVRLPADCLKGTCTTCVGRVVGVEGEDDGDDETTDSRPDAALAVDYRRPPQALAGHERADGYVLLCIALPRADCRIEAGPQVRAEVGDSPWR